MSGQSNRARAMAYAIRLVLLTVLLVASFAVPAQRVEGERARAVGLYSAEVTVNGQGPGERNGAFARGLLHHLFTRVYFPNNTTANAADPLLTALPEDRAATLMAVPDGWFGGPGYRFDIRLQGAGETVFLDLIGGSS